MDKNFLIEAIKLENLQQKLKYLTEEKERIESKLREICGNDTQSFGGYEYKVSERKGLIKYNLIPELSGVDLERYRGENVFFWRLNYTKQFDI